MKRFALLLFTVITFSVLLATSGCEKLETYIVTFNANGGVGTMQAQRYTESVEYALSRNAFSYVGHTFAGWNTSQDGSGTSYRDGQVITVTADMTLYAQWTSNGTNPTPSTSGTINGHEYIDLGLSSGLLWAQHNRRTSETVMPGAKPQQRQDTIGATTNGVTEAILRLLSIAMSQVLATMVLPTS